MSATMRKMVEKQIADALIRDGLAAGYSISVFDSAEFTLVNSASKKDILAAMFTSDDDYLYFYNGNKEVGWVWFVYGNDGWDVISDYTTNLQHIMSGADKVSKKYE